MVTTTVKRKSAKELQEPPEHVIVLLGRLGAGVELEVEAFGILLKEALELGLPHLTLWFQAQLPETEKALFECLRSLQRSRPELIQEIEIDFVGPASFDLAHISGALSFPKESKPLKLHLATQYSGREELVGALQELAVQVQNRMLSPQELQSSTIDALLQTSAIPDPDLVIFLNGEMRLVDAFLWQVAYAELFFSEEYWPKIQKGFLKRALASFQLRDRRFGLVKTPEVLSQAV